MTDEKMLARAREIFDIEIQAMKRCAANLGQGFVDLVSALRESTGNALTSGVGKSGVVAKKIAATLSSTGTPCLYINPVNALHGDLGILRDGDILIALSNSGETQELLDLVQVLQPRHVPVAAFTGQSDSTLAGLADFVIDVGVEREACPLGLAPTASTTACLAAGDALAMVLMEARGFQPGDFQRNHPGGSLGRRLTLKVKDIMRTGDRVPTVRDDEPLSRAVEEMTAKESLGVTLVVGDDGAVAGILTDGDLRRLLRNQADLGGALQSAVSSVIKGKPRAIDAHAPALEALRVMEVRGITSLAIVDSRDKPLGLIHLHDILGRGKFSI